MPRFEDRQINLEEYGYSPVKPPQPPDYFYDLGTELSVPGNPSPNRGNLPVDPAADIYTTRFFPDKHTFTRLLKAPGSGHLAF
jgi:hypothetical protein